MRNEILGSDDVDKQLNIVEELLSGVSSGDEYLDALMRNQQIMARAMQQMNRGFDKDNLPKYTAGLALEEMEPDEPGEAVFDLDGAKYVITVEPTGSVSRNDVVYINGPNNEAAPAPNIDEEQLLGIGTGRGSKRAGAIERDSSDKTHSIQPDSQETVLKAKPTGGGVWVETGTTAQDNSLYRYKVDGRDIFREPLETPLGVYNNLYRFPQPIKVGTEIEIVVRRTSNATNAADYVSKVTYYE